MKEVECKYSPLYRPADKSFLVNFESKNLRPIRVSLPSPPALNLIDGWGLHPDDQLFKRLEIPRKLVNLERSIMAEFRDKKLSVNGNSVLTAFWGELETNKQKYEDEIVFMKKFIYYMWYGYWVFIDGKPTWIPPWYFSYLNMHRMTMDTGYGYPEYRDKGRLRFLFRHYIYNTTETFADLNSDGLAYKVEDDNGNLGYRMVDTGNKLFFGTIEPKDRRGGLTNESCHIITRMLTSTRGADKLGTIVSLGGENAETHFRKKLIPAWSAWPLWCKPVWSGGFGKHKQLEFTPNGVTDVYPLDTMINFTDSADDLANDGKMIISADYDEQGKGKRTGNVQNRWQINKETMSLGGGSKIIGFCIHPSTVEKMEEGGRDYKDMCDLSNFYQRKKDGQTVSGLALCYMPSSYCLENYIDKWGQAIRTMPTERQIRNGFKNRIGSKVYIDNKRKDMYDEDNPVKMDEFRSFVRKFPEDYDECWTGIAGQLGFDNEKIRLRKIELINKPVTVRGEFVWEDKSLWIVRFVEKSDGRWTVAKLLPSDEANQIGTMEAYSAFEDDEIVVNRPANAKKYMMGLDVQQFSNKSESVHLEAKKTKKSDTSIAVLQRRDTNIDISDNPRKWITKHFVASFRARLATNKEATEEALKAAIYYGSLMHIETNRTDVWEKIVEWKFSGYLNFMVEILADGQHKIAPKPGTHLTTPTKKKGFSLLADYFAYHSHLEPIYEFLEEADMISSMEQLTAFDRLAAHLQALLGDDSIYSDLMFSLQEDDDKVEYLGARTYYY
jgi:hypothetical protein